jgi:PadR family transcriptional regulator, regulatory protein PadR
MSKASDSNWLTQAKKGLLELCVLNLIAQEEMYGYQIVKRLTEIPSLVITEGTIYPVLSRMKQEGVIQSTFVESPLGPVRRIYSLSPMGRKRLAEMNSTWREISEGVFKIMIKN